MSITEEMIRQQLAEHAERLQHEGPGVVRWITGGTEPSVYAVFLHRGTEIATCCPHCLQEFGRFDADYGRTTYQQLGVIRQVGHAHLCQQDTR